MLPEVDMEAADYVYATIEYHYKQLESKKEQLEKDLEEKNDLLKKLTIERDIIDNKLFDINAECDKAENGLKAAAVAREQFADITSSDGNDHAPNTSGISSSVVSDQTLRASEGDEDEDQSIWDKVPSDTSGKRTRKRKEINNETHVDDEGENKKRRRTVKDDGTECKPKPRAPRKRTTKPGSTKRKKTAKANSEPIVPSQSAVTLKAVPSSVRPEATWGGIGSSQAESLEL